MPLIRASRCGLLLCGLSLSAAALADDTPAVAVETIPIQPLPQPAGDDSPTRLEAIVVTAQKRTENIQDVPISIQAFSGRSLAASGITNTRQLDQLVPSMQFSSIASYPLVFIRGLGSDNFVPSADPSIATYIDGIYVPNGAATVQSLANIERVEVLKGPQGTLFGRNATGGAISVATGDPAREFETAIEGQIGNFDTSAIKGSASGPLTSWLSLSLSGESSRKDPYYSNPNFRIQADHLDALRLKLRIDATPNLSLTLSGYHSRQSGLFAALYQNTKPSLLGQLFLIQPAEDDYSAETDYPTGTSAGQDIGSGVLSWRTPWFDVKMLGSFQYHSADGSLDFDGSSVPAAALTNGNTFTRLHTGELQILSNRDSWGASRFTWVAGLYYLRSSAGIDPAYMHLAPGLVGGLLALPPLPVVNQLGDRLEDLFNAFGLQNTPLGDGGLTLKFNGILDTRSYSAYAQGTFRFTDWLDLTIGGRVQQERRYLTRAQTALSSFSGDGSLGLFNFDLDSAEASNFAPRAVLGLHPFDDTLLYLSYAVAYKSGTYNIINVYQQPDYIVPERVSSWEVGVKQDFAHGRLRVNAALFDSRIRNLQSGFTSLLSGGIIQFFSVPKARSRGTELNLGWVPMPHWNPGLALSANGAYVDAIYVEFPNGPGYQEGTGLYSDDFDHSGNRLTHTPKWSGNLGLVQGLRSRHGRYELAISESYASHTYSTAQNSDKQPAYAVLNARISYLHQPWRLKLTLFGQNLLDRRYNVLVGPTDFGVQNTLAPPREFGARLNWDF